MTLTPATETGRFPASHGRPFAHDDLKEHQGIGPQDSLPTMDGDFGFGDFLDLINPLQHLPIVGQIYRAVTGDQISGPARILGGALYGGPVGLVGGAANAVIAEINQGQDLGDSLVAQVLGSDEPAAASDEAGDEAMANLPRTVEQGAQAVEQGAGAVEPKNAGVEPTLAATPAPPPGAVEQRVEPPAEAVSTAPLAQGDGLATGQAQPFKGLR